jgi:hypothetical protein
MDNHLKTKVVVAEVSVINDAGVETISIAHDYVMIEIGDHWCGQFVVRVYHFMQVIHHLCTKYCKNYCMLSNT